ESARAHPGRGEGGFDSGMAGADHDNVVEHGTCLESDRGSIMARRPSLAKHAASMFHVKHRKRGPAHADGSLRAETRAEPCSAARPLSRSRERLGYHLVGLYNILLGRSGVGIKDPLQASER